MNQLILREAVKESPVKSEGNRWRVIVAKPGKGSSGTYSAEVFKRDALKMVPPGAQSFFNHDEKRDPRDMLGYFPDGASWSEEDQAVVAELEVFDSWKPLVEQLAPHVGISLYALGEQDDEGNVTSFIEDAYNGADLVSRPGLSGAGFDQKLYEAARSSSAIKETGNDPASSGKETNMEIKELADKVEALTNSVEALVSAQKATVDEAAQIEANEEAVSEALAAYETAIEAIDGADLLPSQVSSLRAEAKAGKDVTALIESAKSIKTEMEKAVTERLGEGATSAQGRVVGSSEATKFGAWN